MAYFNSVLGFFKSKTFNTSMQLLTTHRDDHFWHLLNSAHLAHLSFFENSSFVLRTREVRMSHKSGFTLPVSCTPGWVCSSGKTRESCLASFRHQQVEEQ